jgi:hypothetical protein
MIENIELILISSLILILSIISLIPLIYLNYAKDLNNNINIYNNICDAKKNLYDADIKIKNSYMWNMSYYLFDFNVIQKNFKSSADYVKKPTDNYDDFININRDLSIVDGEFNIMKVYNDYLHSGLPLFIIIWLFFILHLSSVYYNIIKIENTNNKYDYYLHSSLYIFLHVALFTILFSLILKKITEIYADTKAYEYIMFLKEIDILIKERKIEPELNKKFIEIIIKYSGSDIDSVEDIVFTKDLIDELYILHSDLKSKKEYLHNKNDYKLTLENINNFKYYNNAKTIDKLNEEIDDVVRFTIVYFIILFFPIYMLSQAFKSNFTIIAVVSIVMLIFYISGYIVKKKLE